MLTTGYCSKCDTRYYWTRNITMSEMRDVVCVSRTCKKAKLKLTPVHQSTIRGAVAKPHTNKKLWIEGKPRRIKSCEIIYNPSEEVLESTFRNAGRYLGKGLDSASIVARVMAEVPNIEPQYIWKAIIILVDDEKIELRERRHDNGGYRITYRRNQSLKGVDDIPATKGTTVPKTTKKTAAKKATKASAKKTVKVIKVPEGKSGKSAAVKKARKAAAVKTTKKTTKKIAATGKVKFARGERAQIIRDCFPKKGSKCHVDVLMSKTVMNLHSIHCMMAGLKNMKNPEKVLTCTYDKKSREYKRSK